MQLAIVTGANGHLGANLVRVLLAQGVAVRAIIRPGSPHPALEGLPVEIIEHDLRNRDNLKTTLLGGTHLFHAAAVFSFREDLRQQIIAAAVDVTRNVLEAASQVSTLQRIVYTSSTAAIGYTRTPDEILDESNWNDSPRDPYVEGKTRAERVAWELYQERSIPLIVVNPATLMGFYDWKLTPSTQMVLQPLLRSMPFAIPGGMTVADISDVAIGHLQAASTGKIGERYILGGERISVPEFYRTVAELCGVEPPKRIISRTAGKAIIGAMQLAATLTRKHPPLTLQRFNDLYQRYGYYRSDKAMKLLDYHPRAARATIARAIAWLIIGNAIRLETLQKFTLQEDVKKILPEDWKPGKTVQLRSYLSN